MEKNLYNKGATVKFIDNILKRWASNTDRIFAIWIMKNTQAWGTTLCYQSLCRIYLDEYPGQDTARERYFHRLNDKVSMDEFLTYSVNRNKTYWINRWQKRN